MPPKAIPLEVAIDREIWRRDPRIVWGGGGGEDTPAEGNRKKLWPTPSGERDPATNVPVPASGDPAGLCVRTGWRGFGP